jgi:hypothetical protein
MPVMRLARPGAHTGLPQYAFRKFTPIPARRSRWGVRTIGWPLAPRTRPLCWSEQMKTILGRAALWLACSAAAEATDWAKARLEMEGMGFILIRSTIG